MFPIIGIGASAGGLEALQQFLSHVPKDCGMAFVVVQHLSPDHVGNLPELLQRSTTMKVQQVDGVVKVNPDSVYVIPPNRDMTIKNRNLYLQMPDTKQGLRLPIDLFLRSLADDCSTQSIGVILSGMGSDGTLGLGAIKKQGGLTLVQEPLVAKFDSMPKSVIDSGFADIIAPAEELPQRIIDFLGGTQLGWNAEQNPRNKELSGFEMITALLKARTRHDFSLYKPTSVYRRIERRMGVHKIDSIAEYAQFLQKNDQELDLLFKELLIGVTSFFRDIDSWEELKKEALPKILAAYPEGATLRAWSCGCSTGEEAYSLAMSFREALDQVTQPDNYHLQIFATDLNADAIEKARKGLYAATIESDVSAGRLQRFFIKEGNRYSVRKEIREKVTFAQQNVIMDPPFTKLDILICRNLLIYLSTEQQKKLLPLFHYCLKPGGLLFLGSAESIGPQMDLFTTATGGTRLYWRSENVLQKGELLFSTASIYNSMASSQQDSLMSKTADNLKALADHLILKHFSLPTILVNDQGDIVYINGKTGKYLEPAAGKANLNIFAMAREGLQYTLGRAFSQALRQSDPITVRGNLAGADSSIKSVDITIMKIEAPEPLQGMLLIAFKEESMQLKVKRRRTGTVQDHKQLENLELELLKTREELCATREEMQSTLEELKSTNEELQSMNEELQSTNEELTTSKEEMESMNEELQSVNAEQSVQLDDFKLVSNDMENLLNSTEIVTVFLDNHLQIRRFTLGANRLFKLIPSDVGRPMTDIVSNLNYPLIYDHVHEVLRKLISVESEVSALDGRWYLVRIMPYRTLDMMINGVVITCNDITAAKKIEGELQEEIKRLKAQLAGWTERPEHE